jgi:hypothetical protein
MHARTMGRGAFSLCRNGQCLVFSPRKSCGNPDPVMSISDPSITFGQALSDTPNMRYGGDERFFTGNMARHPNTAELAFCFGNGLRHGQLTRPVMTSQPAWDHEREQTGTRGRRR